MIDFYFVKRRTGISAEEAKEIARAKMPAVARPYDKADWYVSFLSRKQQEDRQEPYHLSDEERAELEEWAGNTRYVNMTHFAAERKVEIEQLMNGYLVLLNETDSPEVRENYKHLLDGAATRWAAWDRVRASI